MTATATTNNISARKETPNFGICFCPKCNSILERIHRNRADKLLSFFYTDVTIQRFKCMGCFWEGRRLVACANNRQQSFPHGWE